MDANLSSLGYQREQAWATPAALIALRRLRFTKESLEHEKQVVKSAEIRSDRQQGESVQVGVNGKGGFDFEFSVGDFDEFLESILMSAFADLGGVSTLRNGVTRTSYLFEKSFPNINHIAFLGMMADTLTLNINAKQIITGSLDFVGKHGIEAVATVDAAGGYADAGTGLILSASENVGAVMENGAPVGGIKNISLTFNNNLRGNDAIAVKSIDEVGLGSLLVTGKMDAYFRSRNMVQRFFEHASSSISFEVSRPKPDAVAGDLRGYRFTIPKVKFTKGMPMATGKDTDVMLPIEWEAEDGVIGGASVTAQIERLTVAA